MTQILQALSFSFGKGISKRRD